MSAVTVRRDCTRRSGFTIIELLAVVLIIGVLAAIAITKFGDSKRRAYLAAMKSDLHNLAMIAETQFTSESSYESVEAPRGSAGVTLTFEGRRASWQATATHTGIPGMVCTMSSGMGVASEPLCQ